MRHLIDTYIEADEPRAISAFGDTPLLEIIVKAGMAQAVDSLPGGIKSSKDAVAETIANNVRSRIFQEHLHNPAYYDRMSKLLEEILADLRAKRVDYEAYLQRIADLARQVLDGQAPDTPEVLRSRPWLRAVYDNLLAMTVAVADNSVHEPPPPERMAAISPTLALARDIDDTVRRVRPDDWRGHQARENEIKRALLPLMGNDPQRVERIFPIIKAQREY